MEEMEREDGIRLSEIFKVLRKHIKLLLIIFLIGAVLGSALGFLTSFKVKEYGTRIEFYVNPKRDKDSTANSESQYGIYGAYGTHVMDNMIKLLGSESFAEQLMTDEEGLPPEGISDKLDGLRTAAKDALTEVDTASDEVESAKELVLDYNKKISELNDELILLSKQLSLLSSEESNALSVYLSYVEAGSSDISSSEQTWKTAKAAREAQQVLVMAKEAELKEEKDTLKEQNEAVNTAEEVLEEKIKTANTAVQAALEEWRVADENYEKNLTKFKEAVSFSYFDEETEDVSSLARSFVYVDVKVNNDETFAKEVCNRVKAKIPSYIEANMTVPSGYDSTNCKKITRIDEAVLLNPDFTVKRTVNFGIILALLAVIGGSAVVFIADRCKQRRESQEQDE